MRIKERYFESGLLKRPPKNIPLTKNNTKEQQNRHRCDVMKTVEKDGQVKEGEDSFRDFYFENFM